MNKQRPAGTREALERIVTEVKSERVVKQARETLARLKAKPIEPATAA